MFSKPVKALSPSTFHSTRYCSITYYEFFTLQILSTVLVLVVLALSLVCRDNFLLADRNTRFSSPKSSKWVTS